MKRALILLAWGLAAEPPPTVHQFDLADCDDVAFGPSGDLYFACHSPTEAPADVMDGYVIRYEPRARKVIYKTRVGGSGVDAALRIKVDRAGNAYTTGLTKSSGFPVTRDAGQPSYGGGDSDAFLVKLAPSGAVVYSTFHGGAGAEEGNALDIDINGAVFIGGTADRDAFVCRMEPRKACGTFGGSREEKLTGIALDGKGGLWATGYTLSPDFPATNSSQTLAGPSDAFLVRLDTATLKVSLATLYGGAGEDSSWSIAIGRGGHPVITGITNSTNLPGTAGAYQSAIRGKKDAFIATFDGRSFRATYFGGSSDDESGYDGASVKVGSRGDVWIAGITHSTDLPTRHASQAAFGGGDGDGFVAAFTPDLKRLCSSTYFGGPGRDLLEGLDISRSGSVAVAGINFSHEPSPFHVNVGPSLYAGARLLLLESSRACR